MAKTKGRLYRIAGPVVVAKDLDANMYDLVRVGDEKLMGEVIQIIDDQVIIQVYEDTSGLKPGEPVINTELPLSIELGPGLLTSIYDGIQRPLPVLQEEQGDYIFRGLDAPGLDPKKKWKFTAKAKTGDDVVPGQVLGEVEETQGIIHKIMVPPGIKGKIAEIKSGSYTVDETFGKLKTGEELRMKQKWPVRRPRPVGKKLNPTIPLITGQRIFDALFPLAKGGVAAIPGPFGAGKTVTQQTLAKWCNADIIVYVGCGERGNEMTEVLKEFPHLIDPRTGRPLMNRTVLIANTSNMPVAAREASVYTGVTIAEYYRDMGYSVAMMADSTSRWAEAMREISSRLEEMPGEEGYPAYLATKLAQFYERAGRVVPLGITITDSEAKDEKKLVGKEGSVTLIGAVSPPGGDFSEPVTQNTLRVTKAFWALDAKLAQRRHFPSINWLTSYSLYGTTLEPWYETNVGKEFRKLVGEFMSILQEEEKLLQIVQLVGSDALPEREQLSLEVARLIREFFLQQNSFHEVDTFSDLKKTQRIMKSILTYKTLGEESLAKGIRIERILQVKAKNDIGLSKFEKDYETTLSNAEKKMQSEFASL